MGESPDWGRLWSAAARAAASTGVKRADAEDCASDAVAATYERLAAGAEIASVEAWVVRVAKRRGADVARRASVAARRGARLAPPPQGDPADRVADEAFARWLCARARERLPPVTLDVLRRVAAGEPRDAVAASLGLTPRAVESHLFRARRVLRAAAARSDYRGAAPYGGPHARGNDERRRLGTAVGGTPRAAADREAPQRQP